MMTDDLRLAQNPHTIAERLTDLARRSRDESVRRAVARHPNAPPDVLAQLFLQFPQDVSSNRALPLILIEDPTFLGKIPLYYLKSILIAQDTSSLVLTFLLQHSDVIVVEEARTHVAIAGELDDLNDFSEVFEKIQRLHYHSEESLLELCYLNIAPFWVVKKLASSQNGKTRAAVLGLPQARRLRDLLVRASGSAKLHTLGETPDPTLTTDELRYLASGGPWWQHLAARHPNTPQDVLQTLYDNGDTFLRVRILRNPSTPTTLLTRAAQSQLFAERIAVARNPNLPPLLRSTLENDESEAVRAVIGRPDKPAQKRKKKRKKNSDVERYTRPAAIAPNQSNHPNQLMISVPIKKRGFFGFVDEMKKYYQRETPEQHSEQHNAPLTAVVSEILQKDPYEQYKIARNPQTDTRVLESLANRDRLDKSNRQEIMRGLARNPKTPSKALTEIILSDIPLAIRLEAWRHPNVTPSAFRTKLLEEKAKHIEEVIEMESALLRCSGALMLRREMAYQSPYSFTRWLYRWANVIGTQGKPASLKPFQTDSNRYVRAAVKWRIQNPDAACPWPDDMYQ
jgi:hypothetical protein